MSEGPKGQEMTGMGEVGQEPEFQHPGWQPISKVMNLADPFFENCLFMPSEAEFASNIYIIKGQYLTVVDPGNDYTAFMELWGLGFKPTDIKKIVLTHGHPDNAMGAFELLRAYPSVLKNGAFELILHEAGPREFKELPRSVGCRVTEVRGGETLDLGGFACEVIHTPGHTVDGICLYHAPTKTIFTGDTVLTHAMAEPDKNAGGRLDYYLFSVKSLLKRDIENVLPGHGTPVAAAGKKVIEETYEALLMKIIGVEDKTPWIAGASALVERGLLEDAVFCCDKELARNPEDFKVLELKALCFNDLGRFSEALEVLDQLRKLPAPQSDDVFPLIGRGYALMGLGKYDESIKLYDEALGLKPGTKDAQIYKGMALYLAGNYEQAMDIEHFRTEFVGRFKEELLKKRNVFA